MPANFVTGKPRTRRHHCMKCNGAIKKACYKKRHVAICDAKLEDGRTCGETFTVISRGCFHHPYVEGFNVGVKCGTVPDNEHIKPYFYRWMAEAAECAGKQPEIDDQIIWSMEHKHKEVKV